MILETDTRFQRFVINECVDFRLACQGYGVNIGASKSGVCYCPFHYNKNTPSAKVYSTGLYCFSENRSYNVSDLIDYEIVDDSIQNMFINIWGLLDSQRRNDLLLRFEKISDGSYFLSVKKEYLPLLDYRRNKIDYSEYCKLLLNVLKKISYDSSLPLG